ncbi:MAG: hypothetical protein F4Y91_04275 [Gemmatimonadetes bacterium]|nr:hypothetical protein [Gemmatimonadota bacterium]MXY81287.1 hypothetical protein [Gemmatimonadota bacterium]MYB70579.1 hypothetical protein [Gemmatimonadota bacterium]
MNVIIAAILGGVVLVWGGFLGLLRIADPFERKHVLILAAYTTVVVGCVMGLVLFINHERQKEHRAQLEAQMDKFDNRLSELSTRLIGQLEEKANLTASEFEIRTLLQNEKDHHQRTRNQLATEIDHNNSLQNKIESERKERLRYQSDTDRKLEERFRQEDLRDQNIADAHKRSLANVQAQFGPLNNELTRLQEQTALLQRNQQAIIDKIVATRETQTLSVQKLDALARSLSTLYNDLNQTMAQVDSLYRRTSPTP